LHKPLKKNGIKEISPIRLVFSETIADEDFRRFVTMHWQPFVAFPALYCSYAAIQKNGNLFARVEKNVGFWVCVAYEFFGHGNNG
jgi:hypothetical protein